MRLCCCTKRMNVIYVKKKYLLFISLILLICFVLHEVIIIKYAYNYYSTLVNVHQIFQSQNYDKFVNQKHPVLILFTTFKDIPSRREINENTIKCWGALPDINPIMYVEPSDEPYLRRYGEAHGWKVYESPRLIRGYPVVKDMFLHALKQNISKTFFIGYANSDILFTKGLVDTLKYLRALDGPYIDKKGMFITGQRINTLLEDIKFDPVSGLLLNIDEQDPDQITRELGNALDYFIFTRKHFPWSEIPDFVVGKPGYDNWLAIKAQKEGFITVDASFTINALHQTKSAAHRDKGWLEKDVCMNGHLVDPYDYSSGRSYCLEYFIRRSQQSHDSQLPRFDMYQRDRYNFICYTFFDRTHNCDDLARNKNIQTEIYIIQRF